MKPNISMVQLLKAELFKIKKNKSLYLMLFSQFLVFLIAAYTLMRNFEDFTGSKPNVGIVKTTFTSAAFGILTYFSYFQIILFCSSICETERRNNGYKQLFILPVSKAKIFWSKQVLYLTVLVASWLVYVVAYLLVAWMLSARYGLPMTDILSPEAPRFFMNVFIGILPLYALQYFLSLFFNKFLIPIAFGIIGFAVAIIGIGIMAKSANYNPYAFPLFHIVNFVKGGIFGGKFSSGEVLTNALIEFALLISMSYAYFTLRINASKR